MKLAIIFRKARDLVRKGWVKETYIYHGMDKPVCYCAAGAINTAATGVAWRTSVEWAHADMETAKRLNAAIRFFRGVIRRDIFAWNDARKRTQEQVLAAFDRAIEKAEKLGV
jgi:hypothetical protein